MSQDAVVDLRELLFAAEDIVRTDWSTVGDTADGRDLDTTEEERGEISRATAASTALDRIAQIGVTLIDHSRFDTLLLVIQTLVRLFGDAPRQGAPEGRYEISSALAAMRWRDVAVRGYLLGALAVYREAFSIIPAIIIQHNAPDSHRLWFRETVTFLARSNLFNPPTLIPLVATYIEEHKLFAKLFRYSSDEVVNALCRFDFLQCVVAVAHTGALTECFPNFGAYFNERTEPVVLSLVTGGAARQALPSTSDVGLARIISELDRLAGERFFAYAGWNRNSWTRREISEFLAGTRVG